MVYSSGFLNLLFIMDIALPFEYDDEEREFINALIRNERWAQHKLYINHYSKMMGVCLRYANGEHDALDILHEGFLKVFKNISKYKIGTSLSAWIRRIMINTAIDFYRKNTRRRTEDIDEAHDVSSMDPDAVSQCTEKEILAAIQQLSPAYRAVFNLNVIEGYPHKEIASKLGITESTSRSNLTKARTKLQETLASFKKT